MRLKIFRQLICIFLVGNACHQPVDSDKTVYHYNEPDYNKISVIALKDTLHFSLGETMYNEIKSFNLFNAGEHEYISFYDRRSETINIYGLKDQGLYKRISIKKLLGNHSLYKTSIFVRNWDSIFVVNKDKLRLYDGAGHRKKSVKFLDDPEYAWAVFDCNKLPVIVGDNLYAMVRPNLINNTLKELREWKVMYALDLKSTKARLVYHLPEIYQKHLYGYYFLDYNFCFNEKGKFVLSFPADTVIYETDFDDYNQSYYARSKFQNEIIKPVSRQILKNESGGKEYAVRDSYGSIFFDPFKNYYLRLARHKITESDYQQRKRKSETVLVFDDKFKIVGESHWPEEIDFGSLFFSRDGKMYARTNFKDENALHFVRLEYRESIDNTTIVQANK